MRRSRDTTAGRTLAVTYLRVSTKEQAQKEGTDEGYSIPAQRAASYKKADELDALVVEEFVDADVVLVSATENIDETRSGMLLHGIMSTIAEFCI
ncbi:MAG: hypothetical protein LBJ02_09095 [Bifidobacteriaceae bacterium]|jgi:DNA invertase Pin-like site-specific DNA recombinase|nr:hypothetical protein [Bifidobacteriaceae bacterium]